MYIAAFITGCPSLQHQIYCVEALRLNLVNHTIDAIVQQLLVVVVQGGVHLVISQPGILPDLLQGVVLHEDTVFKNSH